MRGIVVAHDQNRVIGSQGELPWGRSMPRDLQRFRTVTLGSPVVMGRHTFESIGRPLPDRKNIVVSRTLESLPGITVVGSLDEAFEVTTVDENVYVIGGSSIYELAVPVVDKLFVTKIDASFDDGDAFFVEIDHDEWEVETEEFYPKDESNQFDCTFLTYRRSTANGEN